jgi:hypothetical protein
MILLCLSSLRAAEIPVLQSGFNVLKMTCNALLNGSILVHLMCGVPFAVQSDFFFIQGSPDLT